MIDSCADSIIIPDDINGIVDHGDGGIGPPNQGDGGIGPPNRGEPGEPGAVVHRQNENLTLCPNFDNVSNRYIKMI